MIYNSCFLMESFDTSDSSPNASQAMFNLSPTPLPLAWMMIKSLLLEEKGETVKAFKSTAAL